MAAYLNDVPKGYGGARCQHAFFSGASGQYCGLSAWEDAPETEAGDPRCVFHSERTPDDILELLEAAVARGDALWEAKLAGADLVEAELRGAELPWADLSGAELSEATLSGANLGWADLSAANLGWADLSCARMDGARLLGTLLYETDLTGADLRSTTFGGLWRLAPQRAGGVAGGVRYSDLTGANLTGALLTGTTVPPEVDLGYAKFGLSVGKSGHTVRDEFLAADDEAWKAWRDDEEGRETEARPSFSWCARVYRQLKLSYQQSGNYSEAGEWYFSEKRCERRQMSKDGKRWPGRAVMFLVEKVAGYGERPSWVLYWLAAVAVVFALGQGQLGVYSSRHQYVIAGIERPVTVEGLKRAVACFHFSVTTLTTLGYGDYSPSSWAGQLVAGTEAVLGFVLLSLFLVCVVRKFSR